MHYLTLLCSLLFLSIIYATDKPNIVFILSDDQAWMDYGFMGHPDIKTPHLDKLAEKSLVFERGYVASPLCRPSLATMVTGRYPFTHRVTGNDVNGRVDRAALDVPVKKYFHKYPSFIKTLTNNGYLAHQSGKWWEGSYKDGGFTHGMTHGDPKKGGRHGDAGLQIGRKGLEPITNFIDMAQEQKKPFLIWYAPFLPHTPHNPPKRLLEKYTKEGRALDVAKYYAMCEWFDETCGGLTGYIDKKGLTQNTMFVYICDNGWAAKSTNANDPTQKQWKGYAIRSKGSPYENGIRTPIMVSWPGKVIPQKSKSFAHAIDLFPTIVEAAGIKKPKGLPGINLLDSKAVESRKNIFGVCHAIHNMSPNNTDETLHYLWTIEGPWKLLLRYQAKDTTHYAKVHSWDKTPVQLYNIIKDPHEKSEVSKKYPKIVKQLTKKIKTWHPVQSGKKKSTSKSKYHSSVSEPTFTEVAYGTHERHVLDFWQAKSDKPTPLVFVIHGGGWKGGDKERLNRFADCKKLLENGISVAAINYRLMKHVINEKPPVRVPLYDAARALQFVRSKAKEWNIDKNKIGAAGGSAGACSSLWLSYHDDLAEPKSKDLISRESSRLQCAAVIGPQTTLDPLQMKTWTPNSRYGGHAFGFNDFNTFLTGRDSIKKWIEEYSPYANVSSDDPPTWMGFKDQPAIGKKQKDPTHTVNFGVKLQERCKEVGIECEVYYPGSKARYDNPTDFLISNLKN